MSIQEAIVIGSGPNGLAAALTLAEQGVKVRVLERNATLGGGLASWRDEFGVLHDHCSAVHALAQVSPFFQQRQEQLSELGLQWCFSEVEVAHPLATKSVAHYRCLEQTAAQFSRVDARAWRKFFQPLLAKNQQLFQGLLGPLLPPVSSWGVLAGFAPSAIRSALWLAREMFETEEAQALFAGHAAHSIQPLGKPATAGFGAMLGLSAHANGWPIARGGSQAIADALIALCKARGVEFECGVELSSLDEIPPSTKVFFNTNPRTLAKIAGERLPLNYRKRLQRFRHGAGAFKVDFVLSKPVPWRDEACRKAITIHLGGTLDEIAESERLCWQNSVSEKPYVLVAQQSRFDATRCGRNGEQNLWAYCHVPPFWQGDATEAIVAQIEAVAPGFRSSILAMHKTSPAQFEEQNPNFFGGDISGGVQDLFQQFTRPVIAVNPYATPDPQIFLCSASTPPGAGVHGMCGVWAVNKSASL